MKTINPQSLGFRGVDGWQEGKVERRACDNGEGVGKGQIMALGVDAMVCFE